MQGQQEEGHHKPWREISGEISPAGTMIMAFQLPGYKKMHFCSLWPCGLKFWALILYHSRNVAVSPTQDLLHNKAS